MTRRRKLVLSAAAGVIAAAAAARYWPLPEARAVAEPAAPVAAEPEVEEAAADAVIEIEGLVLYVENKGPAGEFEDKVRDQTATRAPRSEAAGDGPALVILGL